MGNDAYKTGVVSAFAGSSGLLDALLDFILGTEVTAESLSGSGTSWSGTLANSPIGYGRLSISYVIGGTTYEGTDDGAGAITGTNITAGTINYVTGAYSITFSASVTGTPTADYLYGEPGQDWKQLESTPTTDQNEAAVTFTVACKEVILQNTGNSGLEQVMVGIREWEYPAQNAAGWDLSGYLWHNDGMWWRENIAEQGTYRDGYSSSWEHWHELPMMPLIDANMTYWFFSNRQRIIVVAKVQSNYESIYLGFGNRYGSPSRYPYPLIIKGSMYGDVNYSSTSASHRGIFRNTFSSAGHPLMTVDPGSEWRHVVGGSLYVTGMKMVPGDNWSADGTIGPGLDDAIFSQPCSLVYDNNFTVYMDLDGVLHLASTGILSEDTMKDPDNLLEYLIFQDVHRTTYSSFFAVEKGSYTTTTTTTTTTTV